MHHVVGICIYHQALHDRRCYRTWVGPSRTNSCQQTEDRLTLWKVSEVRTPPEGSTSAWISSPWYFRGTIVFLYRESYFETHRGPVTPNQPYYLRWVREKPQEEEQLLTSTHTDQCDLERSALSSRSSTLMQDQYNHHTQEWVLPWLWGLGPVELPVLSVTIVDPPPHYNEYATNNM